ncbi:MAG: hypothetical protein EPN21_07755, partial [Methylococcaceae bacterium]
MGDDVDLFIQKCSPPDMNRVVQETLRDYSQHFGCNDEVRNFLRSIIVPRSKRWSFISTGKSASSTMLSFLFEAEFGCQLSAHFEAPFDINPSAVVHQLAETQVFMRAIYVPLSAADILGLHPARRIAVVRDPLERAISAFLYFCKSDELKKSWFLGDRLRINAIMQFDWNTMPYTPEGFKRFLQYIQHETARLGHWRIDAHWRPQYHFIYPGVFAPTHIGKVEKLDEFL